MIVAIGNTKGGVGKTTIAVQIAIERALSGRDVWLIDGDQQGTASTSIAARAEMGLHPGIACAQYSEGKQLRAQLLQQRDKWDDIIIDVGGRDSSALRAALILADILIVPFAPRSYDVWALEDIAELVNEAHGIRDGLRAFTLLNQADPGNNSSDNIDAADAVKEISQLMYLNTPIRRRKSFSNACGAGMSVSEMKPKDQKAIDEIKGLVDIIFNL